jgi:3-hydroxybutyryl-CoA dehydratase
MHPSLCTYDDLSLGQQASFTKTITDADISHFIAITGDVNPLHVDASFAARTFFKKPIAHGMLAGALFSHVLGMLLPGTGAIYRSQVLHFIKPVYVGDTLKTTLEISAIDREAEQIELGGVIRNQAGACVVEGTSVATLLRGLVG